MQLIPTKISQTKLILSVTLFITLFHNATFIQKFTDAYSGTDLFWLHLISLILLHGSIVAVVLSFAGFSRSLKPSIIVMLLLSSMTSYFIDTYHVVIDTGMIANIFETDSTEVSDILNLRLSFYIFTIGLAPAFLVYKIPLSSGAFRHSLLKRFGMIVCCISVLFGLIYLSSDFYTSFFRANKLIRYYANPTTPIYSLFKYADSKLREHGLKTLIQLGNDAKVPSTDTEYELVVLVVGETARSDHFSLNGYKRETNPLLSQEHVVSFRNIHSCGTSTAVSVPCMFSFLERDEYDEDQAKSTENVLDILQKAGVRVLWRDNNSGSKGVANRIEYESFRHSGINPICDLECRDEGMLVYLDDWVDQNKNSDILIVLHQIGSHGPAYFKRYPQTFERFKPTCRSNLLSSCTRQEVINTYDNTLLYTDHFLSRVIHWLKHKSPKYETSMLYISDHGESLGESGIYLHGLPFSFAPIEQTHVPMIIWSPEENRDIDIEALRHIINQPLSQDNLFHTLLGLFEIESGVYQISKDILKFGINHS
ncbi:MAG: phosphoethanolamine--lipid A transferase [Candidatus Thiodiazotropha sp.]